MEVIWLILGLLALDLAAYLFAADTRPGFEHSARPLPARSRPPRPAVLHSRAPRIRPGRPRTHRILGG